MKISKHQAATLLEFRDVLAAGHELILETFDARLREVAAGLAILNALIDLHNADIARARHFVEEIAAELRDEYDQKSERWHESDAGQQAEAMIQAWENASLEDVEPVVLLLPDRPLFKEGLDLPMTEEDA